MRRGEGVALSPCLRRSRSSRCRAEGVRAGNAPTFSQGCGSHAWDACGECTYAQYTCAWTSLVSVLQSCWRLATLFTKAYLSHVYWASTSRHILCYSTLHRSWHATHPTPPLLHEEGASQASTSKLTRQCDHTWARRISISGHRHCRLCVIRALAKSGFGGKDTCSRALGGAQAGEGASTQRPGLSNCCFGIRACPDL